MTADGRVLLSRHGLGTDVLGSSPDGTVRSSNSARCHRARFGETSRRHSPSGELPRASVNDAHDFDHLPVMLDEILAVFGDLDEGTFLDATVGGAGHSSAIATAHPALGILALDRDPVAVEVARRRLAGVPGRDSRRITVRRCRFDSVAEVLDEEGVDTLAGALFDLGVSSPQLDLPARGFSYRVDGPLDMRMDPESDTTAADVVNSYDEASLVRLLRENADERFAARIARAIVANRPLHSSVQLAGVVTAAIPAAARRRGGHPAKRTFQALRIEVNQELAVLEPALRAALGRLAPGARLAVLSYHSGEDRIVKAVLRDAETGGCTCPAGLPCACGRSGSAVRVRAPRTTSASEVAANPRARSARLRVVERRPDGAERA